MKIYLIMLGQATASYNGSAAPPGS